MTTDPILAEVYRWKEEGGREVNYDMDILFDKLDAMAEEHPDRYVNVHDQLLELERMQKSTR
jgi:hypothetical protein